MQKYKVVILGGGLIAETAHIPAILKNNRCEIVAIVESNKERGTYLIEKYNLDARVYSRISEVPGRIDCAVICTPNFLHYENVMECFDLGINVLVEKPISNTVAEGIQMNDVAKTKGLVIMVGYCTRFWRSVQDVKEIIDSGIYGDVKKFAFQYGAAGGWAPLSNYIMKKSSAGGGALVINGSHYLDRIIWLFGNPTSIKYYDDSKGGVEANAEVHFEYGEGHKRGMLKVSKTVFLEPGCVIELERATLIHKDWTAPFLFVELKGVNQGEFVQYKLTDKKYIREDMYELQFNEFLMRVENPEYDAISNIGDSLLVTEIMENSYRSKRDLNTNWY